MVRLREECWPVAEVLPLLRTITLTSTTRRGWTVDRAREDIADHGPGELVTGRHRYACAEVFDSVDKAEAV